MLHKKGIIFFYIHVDRIYLTLIKYSAKILHVCYMHVRCRMHALMWVFFA